MTRRSAHSYRAEVAHTYRRRHAAPAPVRQSAWHLVLEFLVAFLVFFVPIALVILNADVQR